MNEFDEPVNQCMSRNWLRDVIEAPTRIDLRDPGEETPATIHESHFRAHKLLNWIGDMLSAGLAGRRAHLLLREVDEVAQLVDRITLDAGSANVMNESLQKQLEVALAKAERAE